MAQGKKYSDLAVYCLIVIVSVAVLAEVFLRATGKYRVFSEMNGQPFYSEYGQVKKSWFYTRPPNDSFVPAGVDFHYLYITNRYGFRDKNYDTAKSQSVVRILVTGDSFAEGEGAPYDSTWPRILEKFLNEKGIHAEVIDAGVAGSDIFFDYVHYREKLKELHPDLVIASINSSDYNDYLTRGGMERFQLDGTTRFKPKPWYMPFYVHSRFVRAMFHIIAGFNNTGLFVSYKEFDKSAHSTNVLFADVFKRFKEEAAKNGAGFIAVVHTIPFEIKSPQLSICQTTNRGLNELATLLTSEGVRCFNLSKPLFNEFLPMTMQQLTYPHDMHYTPVAYAYMGKIISDSLMVNKIVKP